MADARMYHDAEVELSIHISNNWVVADYTALLALTGMVTADLKKLALLQDDWSTWMLTAISPSIVWTQITSPSRYRVTNHVASAAITATGFEGIHVVNHAVTAIDLTLPAITALMLGKKALIYKKGAGNAAFVADATSYMGDGAAGGRLQNTVGLMEAKLAWASVMAISLTEYLVDFGLGGWQTT